MNIDDLTQELIAFRDRRDWKQFHDPKSLAGSIVIESTELYEIFQWTETEKSLERALDKKEDVKEEMADILAYLFTLAHDLDIDLIEALSDKINKNNNKSPIKKSKWTRKKYTEL